MRLRICLLSAMLLLSGVSPAAAQMVIRSFDPQFFDGGNQILLKNGFSVPEGAAAGFIFAADGKAIGSVPRPGPRAHLDYAEGSFWAYERLPINREKKETTVILRAFTGGKWLDLGSGTFKGVGPTMAFRLGNGTWLGVTAAPEVFIKNGESMPFGIMKINDRGELQVISAMEGGLEKPFFSGNDKSLYYKALMLPFLGMFDKFVRTQDKIILFTHYGYFWIFDSENGNLRHVSKMYSTLKDEDLTGRSPYPLLPGLHGLGGRRDGKVLISARDEGAVAYGMVGRSDSNPDPKAMNAAVDAIYARFPRVEWWVLDPDTGKLEREVAPDGFPTNLFSDQEVMDFNWRILPNGHLKKMTFEEIQETRSIEVKEPPKGPTRKGA